MFQADPVGSRGLTPTPSCVPGLGLGQWRQELLTLRPLSVASICFSELCPRHSPLDPTPHTLVQPISAMLASDPASCPRCQHEVGRRPSGLGSTDSGQEGSGLGSSGGGEDEADGDGARSSEEEASSGLEKEDEEEQADGAARLCGDVWRETRAKLRGIVDSKYFNRGIMMAILVNTISMGIEHHEQASGAERRGQAGSGGGGPGRASQPHPARVSNTRVCLSPLLARAGSSSPRRP